MDLKGVAQIAQEFGRDAVRAIMAASGHDSPWEINERFLQAAILKGFWESVKDAPLERRLRICDEVALNSLANVSFPNSWDWPVESAHRLDLVIFEPLRESSPGTKDPWHRVNRKARGVIELKKYGNNKNAIRCDCQCLEKLAGAWLSPGEERPWAMLVVFVNGANAATVKRNAGEIEKLADESQLTLQAAVAPESVEEIPGSGVGDRWFDVVCFGR